MEYDPLKRGYWLNREHEEVFVSLYDLMTGEKQMPKQPFSFIITKRQGPDDTSDPEVLDDGFTFATSEKEAREKVLFELDKEVPFDQLDVYVRPF